MTSTDTAYAVQEEPPVSKRSGPAQNRPGKPTLAQQRASSERAAAARARIVAAQRRRRLWVVGGSLLGIVAVVAALIIVKVATGAGGPESGKKATTANASVIDRVTSVPATTLNSIGTGDAKSAPVAITAPALTANGKPQVLYVGAEYCPYCAAERWPVAVALSRFGTFTGVGETTSSPSDVFPSTATLSFHDISYTSDYLSLTAKELQSNQVENGTYAPLDKLTSAEQAIVTKYNAAPYVKQGGGIPFVDLGGKYLITGASYDPQVLQGKTHAEIAAALSQPTSAIAKAVNGTANLVTAALCDTTGQKPTNVCTSAGVTTAAAELDSSG